MQKENITISLPKHILGLRPGGLALFDGYIFFSLI